MTRELLLVLIQGASLFAALATQRKRIALLLWVAGILQGVLFLVSGSEVLAVLQWLQASFFGFLTLIYLTVLGGGSELPQFELKRVFGPVLLSIGFGGVLWEGLAATSLQIQTIVEENQLTRMNEVGKALVMKHFLLIPVLAVFSLVAVVGIGQMTRPETKRI